MTFQAFDKKGIWQSDMAKAGEMTIMFTGSPRDSKYQGKPPFVGFKVQGDETAYTLNIENNDIRAAIEGAPQNVWMKARFEGSRDGAYVMFEDDAGPVITGTPASEVRTSGPPPNEWGDGEPAGPQPTAGPFNGKLDQTVYATIRAVQGLERGGIRVDSDAAARIFNTLFIQAHR